MQIYNGADTSRPALGYFTFPTLTVAGGVTNEFRVTETVTVTSMPEFIAFSDGMVFGTSVSWTIAGRADLSMDVAGVSLTLRDVPMVKTVTMAACAGLKNFTLLVFTMDESTNTCGRAGARARALAGRIAAARACGDLSAACRAGVRSLSFAC